MPTSMIEWFGWSGSPQSPVEKLCRETNRLGPASKIISLSDRCKVIVITYQQAQSATIDSAVHDSKKSLLLRIRGYSSLSVSLVGRNVIVNSLFISGVRND
jgi:hypothetical protein